MHSTGTQFRSNARRGGPPRGRGKVGGAGEASLDSLLAECRPGWALPGKFHSAEAIYRADLDRVWRTGWLFAGHACEIPKPGDYFSLQVDADPLIVIRGQDGTIHGLHNVCRHRGSIICHEGTGHATRLVCPYHQWTYGLDGALLSCRGMQELDKSQFGLQESSRAGSGRIDFLVARGRPRSVRTGARTPRAARATTRIRPGESCQSG